MLWTILTILLVLWFLGMVTTNTFGGGLHLLLLGVVAIVIIRIIKERKPLG